MWQPHQAPSPIANRTLHVKYIGVIDGRMGILTRQAALTPNRPDYRRIDSAARRCSVLAPPCGTAQQPFKVSAVFKRHHQRETAARRPGVVNIGLDCHSYADTSLRSRNRGGLSQTTPKRRGKQAPSTVSLLTPDAALSTLDVVTLSGGMKESESGIPNPEKYNRRIVNNGMRVSRLKTGHRQGPRRPPRDLSGLLNVRCPESRRGVTGIKFTRRTKGRKPTELRQDGPEFGELTIPPPEPDAAARKLPQRRVKNWELYQIGVLLRRGNVVGRQSQARKHVRRTECFNRYNVSPSAGGGKKVKTNAATMRTGLPSRNGRRSLLAKTASILRVDDVSADSIDDTVMKREAGGYMDDYMRKLVGKV